MKKQAQNKQASVFKPLIATSLALALGVSVASAVTPTCTTSSATGAPEICFGNGTQDISSSQLQITWNGNSPQNDTYQITNSKYTNGSFGFYLEDPSQSQSIEIVSDTDFDNGYKARIYGQSSLIIDNKGKTIKMGNNGTSTLGVGGATGTTVTLNFETVANSSNYALLGNLFLGGWGSGVVNATFGGKGIKGDVTVKGGDNNITFNSGAQLDGNLNAKGGSLTFKSATTITGGINNINGGVSKITFKQTAIINGDILSKTRINGGGTTIIAEGPFTLYGNIIAQNYVDGGSFWDSINNIILKGASATIGQENKKSNVQMAPNQNNNYNTYGHNAIITSAATNTFKFGNISVTGTYGDKQPDKTHNLFSFNDGATTNTLTANSISTSNGNTFIGKNIANESGFSTTLFDNATSNPTKKSDFVSLFIADTYQALGSFTIGSGSSNAIVANSGGNNYLNIQNLTISGNLEVNGSGSSNNINAGTLAISGNISAIISGHSASNYNIISAGSLTLNNPISITASGNDILNADTKNLIDISGTTTANGNLSILAHSAADGYKSIALQNIIKFGGNVTFSGTNKITSLIARGKDPRSVDITYNVLSFDGSGTQTLTIDSINAKNDLEGYYGGSNYIGKGFTAGSKNTLTLNSDLFNENGVGGKFWDDTTHQANLTLTVTNPLYAKNGSNYINVANLNTADISLTSGGKNYIKANTLNTKNISVGGGDGGSNYIQANTLQVRGDITADTNSNGAVKNTLKAANLTLDGSITTTHGQTYIYASDSATLNNISTLNNPNRYGGGVNYLVFDGTKLDVGNNVTKANITIDMTDGGNISNAYGHNVIVANTNTNTFHLQDLSISGAYGAGQSAKTYNILSFNNDSSTNNKFSADSITSGFGNTIIGKDIANNTGLSNAFFDNTTTRDPSIKANFATTFMSDTYTAKGTFTIGTGSGNAITAGEGAGNYLNVESLIINGAVKTTSNGVNYLYANKKLTISNGVSGTNSITLEAGDSTQTTSVIKNIVSDEQNTLTLGTAVSGTSNLDLNVANSQLGAGVTAIEGYLTALKGDNVTATEKNAILNSSVIAGSIVSSGNTNIKIVGTQNTTTKTPTNKAQIGILGNINNNNGVVFNAIMQDAFFAPTEFLVKQGNAYQPVLFGGTQAGTITTGANATTTVITRFTNPVVNSSGISMYGLDVDKNSTTNIAIQGNINVGTYIDYEQGSTINLIFANANNIASDSVSDSFEGNQNNLTGNGSKLLGVTYQDGVKLAIADKTVLIGDSYASFLDTYSSYYTDGSKPLATVWAERTDAKDTVGISGLVVGDIYSLASSTSGSQTKKIYDVTLESGSAFAGKIKLDPSTTSDINIVMKENSKLILSDTKDSTATDTFVINSLEIQGKEVDTYQLQMETLKQTNNVINLASGGASANNVVERENFRLLVVGNATAVNTPATSGGLSGDGKAVFMTYVNTNADQNKATLGKVASSGKKSSRAGGTTAGQYGNIYSDRIIIANIGNNQTAKSGDYYMQFAVDSNSKLGNVTYNANNDVTGNSNGGVKTAGNIAVLTVANVNGKAGINLKTQDVLQGFDRIGGDLIAVQTDVNGVYDEKGAYTTYFINHLNTRGATEATQEVTASAFATNYDLYLANFNSLNKRMGELRDNANSQGVWARVFSGAQSNDFSKSKSTYTTIQGGYDYALGFEGANNYIGLAVSYSMSSSKSDLNAIDINGSTKGIEDIKSSAVEVAVYNSYVQDEGWYNDTIAKFSYIMSDFTMIGQTSNYSTNNMAFTLSDEFGYRFKLGEAREWYIDPQLEMAFGYFNQSDFVQTLGLSSLEGVAESIYTTRARLGSSFGYDFKKFTENKPIKASVYVGAFYEYDYVVGGDVTLTTNLGGETVSSSAISSDGRVVVNVGTNMTIKDNTRIYFDFETSFAGKITTDYQANVGVRYSFGENTGYTPFDPNKKSITPLKVSDENAEESEESESVENTQESTQTTTSEQTSEASKESANSKDNKTEESAEVKSEEKAQ